MGVCVSLGVLDKKRFGRQSESKAPQRNNSLLHSDHRGESTIPALNTIPIAIYRTVVN